MQIRVAKLSDIGVIETFEVFDHDISSAIEAGRCLVAESEGRAVAYVVYALRGLIGKDFVKFLVVDPAYRRRGVALLLLRGVEGAVGAGRLYISTGGDNATMQALLHKDGWTAAGQIDGINANRSAELFFYRDLP